MKKLCFVFLAFLISWPAIVFGQEFNSVVVLQDSSFVSAAIDSIRSHGGTVNIAIISDNIIMCSMPVNAKKQLIGRAGIKDVLFKNELVGITEGPLTLCQPLLYPDYETGPIPVGKKMEPDMMISQISGNNKLLKPQDEEEQITLNRSIYLVGDQAVQVFVVEGGGDRMYDWQSTEKNTAEQQFLKGLAYIQTVARNSYNIDITWIVNISEVTITHEPSLDQSVNGAWMGEALAKAGLGGIEETRESMIRQYGALGALVVFIYSDANDNPGYDTLQPRVMPRVMSNSAVIEDTAYSAHWGSCWARMYEEDLKGTTYYYGGGYCILSKSASGWGASHLWSTTVHELFHCCGALDEYPESGCSQDQSGGYLHGQNNNCCGSSPCIMRHSVDEWGFICPYTAQMIGWAGGGTSINQLPQSLFLPTYEYIFFPHAKLGDYVSWWTLAGGLIEGGKRATRYNTYCDPNDSSLCGMEGDARNMWGEITAPLETRLYYINSGSDVMKTAATEITGSDLNIVLSNFTIEDNHILRFDRNIDGPTRIEINGPGVKIRPVWDRAIRGVCDFGFLPDTTYNAKIFAWRPSGSVSPVYNYPFRVHRGAPKPPVIASIGVDRKTPENTLILSLADTNYYIDGIRVEKWNGHSWDSASVIPGAGASIVSERIGSKVDTLRAISFNANGSSTPTLTTIKNAPNSPSKVLAGACLRDRNALPGSGLGKKAPGPVVQNLVKTNQINVAWEPPVNQLDSIAYYKVSYSYYQSCINPPWCDVYPTFFSAPICSTYYSIYPLPKEKQIDVRVYAYDLSGDSSACVLISVTTGAYDAHPQMPDMCDKQALIPAGFAFSQNYPNPFNSQTVINYALPTDSRVDLTIYNILGQKVRTLVDGIEIAGFKQVIWDGRNDRGETVSSGIYFCTISTDSFHKSVKMSVVK